jgi:mono/diheme cytochrome c family protein
MTVIRSREARRIALGAAACVFAFSLAAPRAQQPPAPSEPQTATPQQGGQRGGRGQRGGGQPAGEGQRGAPPASTAKPVVPVAANTLLERPDAFIGESVTLTGPVGQSLSGTAFSVQPAKGTKASDKDVLVLAPRLNEPVAQNGYVTAIGPVIRFDPDEVSKHAKDIKVDLPPDVIAKYRGQPVILATAVINGSGVNLAQRLPPAMTTEEQSFQKVMQQVGPANTALRAAIDKMDANAAKENAAILQQAFVKTEAFWKSRGKNDAVQLAQEAHKEADGVGQALAAAKWDDAKTTAASLAQKCAACHGEYRERFDDGSFRIKAGTK